MGSKKSYEVLQRSQKKNYIGLREAIVSLRKSYLRWAWKVNWILSHGTMGGGRQREKREAQECPL